MREAMLQELDDTIVLIEQLQIENSNTYSRIEQ